MKRQTDFENDLILPWCHDKVRGVQLMILRKVQLEKFYTFQEAGKDRRLGAGCVTTVMTGIDSHAGVAGWCTAAAKTIASERNVSVQQVNRCFIVLDNEAFAIVQPYRDELGRPRRRVRLNWPILYSIADDLGKKCERVVADILDVEPASLKRRANIPGDSGPTSLGSKANIPGEQSNIPGGAGQYPCRDEETNIPNDEFKTTKQTNVDRHEVDRLTEWMVSKVHEIQGTDLKFVRKTARLIAQGILAESDVAEIICSIVDRRNDSDAETRIRNPVGYLHGSVKTACQEKAGVDFGRID